jgi:hypothetical protein
MESTATPAVKTVTPPAKIFQTIGDIRVVLPDSRYFFVCLPQNAAAIEIIS